MHHIKTVLPDIKMKIQSTLLKSEQELASLGGATGEGNGVCPHLSSRVSPI